MPLISQFPDAIIQDKPCHELILEGIREHVPSERKAMINSETSVSYTYRDVHNIVYVMASHLHKGIIRKLRHHLKHHLSKFSSKKGEELERQFKDCQCKFVFTTESVLPKVRQAAKGHPFIKKIYVMDHISKSKGKDPLIADFDSLCQVTNARWQPMDLPKGMTHIYDVIGLVGKAEGGGGGGLAICYAGQLFSPRLHGKRPAFFMRPARGDTILGFLPFFHIYGFFIMLAALRDGVTMVTMPQFDPKKFLELIQRYKVRYLNVVPPIMVFMAKHPMVSDYDVSSVEMVGVGAAPVGKDISEALMERLPHIKYVLQGYGMTEVSVASHIMPPIPKEEMKHGSVGLLLPNYQCKVMDTETGAELGANQRGEICVKCVSVMLGYWNRPDATAQTIDPEGWLHTGDIGYYDEEEFFYIVDRLKELIKVKGFQVPPAELEDLLLSHPEIQDAAVIGIDDEMAGELPKAFIVKRENSKLEEIAVQKFVEQKVAPYKRLAGGVEFIAELPKSPSGKILRRILKDEERKKKKQTSKL